MSRKIVVYGKMTSIPLIAAIVGGTLIDGTGKKPVQNSIVVIKGSRIAAVGRGEEIEIPRGKGKVIYARGKVVMPGLIDTHVHITHLYGQSLEKSLLQPLPHIVLEAARNMQSTLEAGYTSIRSCGDIEHIDIYLKRAVESGFMSGPRLMTCGKAISITGGHADTYFAETGKPLPLSWGRLADGPDEMRKAVREEIKAGVDCIKLMSSSGMNTPERVAVGTPHFTVEEMKVACEEAHKMGKRVAAHCLSAQSTKNAVSAGVDTIEHGYGIDEEACVMMKGKGIILTSSLSVPYLRGKFSREELRKLGYSDLVIDKTLVFPYESRREWLRLAIKQGVKIAPGSDPANPLLRHGQNALELQCLVDAGLSNMETIVATTKTAAEALGLEKQTGTIEPGKSADIIVVDGNPLSDIRVLQDIKRIHTIIKEGEGYKVGERSHETL